MSPPGPLFARPLGLGWTSAAAGRLRNQEPRALESVPNPLPPIPQVPASRGGFTALRIASPGGVEIPPENGMATDHEQWQWQ